MTSRVGVGRPGRRRGGGGGTGRARRGASRGAPIAFSGFVVPEVGGFADLVPRAGGGWVEVPLAGPGAGGVTALSPGGVPASALGSEEGYTGSRRGLLVSLPRGDVPEESEYIQAAALVSQPALYSKELREHDACNGSSI